jgi:hypothetical protein
VSGSAIAIVVLSLVIVWMVGSLVLAARDMAKMQHRLFAAETELADLKNPRKVRLHL